MILVIAYITNGKLGVGEVIAWYFSITVVYLNSFLNPDSLLLEDERGETSIEGHSKTVLFFNRVKFPKQI